MISISKLIDFRVLCLIPLALIMVACDTRDKNVTEHLDEEACLNTPEDKLDDVIPEKFSFDCTQLRYAHFSSRARKESERLTQDAMEKYSSRALPGTGQSAAQGQTNREWSLEMYDKLKAIDQN